MRLAALLSMFSMLALSMLSMLAPALALRVPPRDYAANLYFVVELDPQLHPGALEAFTADYNGTFHYQHAARGLDHHHVFSVARSDPHAQFLGNHNLDDRNHMKRAGHELAHDRLVQYPGLRLVHMMTPRRLQRRMPVPMDEGDSIEGDGVIRGDGIERDSVAKRIKITDSSQEPLREVSERLAIEDPIFAEQWHLVNTLSPGNDVNVKNVWYNGVRGKGVTVAVVDDGLDTQLPDLAANFNAAGLWDFNDNTATPNPRLFDDYHGTRCAGEIAAVKNDVCGVGVAWEAQVAGIRILSGLITAEEEAAAMVYGLDHNDIYSCLWGPTDNGRTVAAPDVLVRKAIIKGVQQGRDSRGAVYVFASGNGGRVDDQCNFDGYTNSIYSITVGAIDYQGNHPPYLEACSAVMVVTYSSGGREHIHTTDIKNKCATTHGGTSAAAPLAAGVYALVLSANPSLSWRDVQYVLARAAVPVNEHDGDYQLTALGEKYLHKYGYGKLDAERIVAVAQNWTNVKPQAWYYSDVRKVHRSVSTTGADSDPLVDSIVVSPQDLAAMHLQTVEHVTVKVNIALNMRGRISVRLVSPTGVVSTLARFRPVDNTNAPLKDWVFMSVAHLGELGVGEWRLEVVSGPDNTLEFQDWQLRLFGEISDADKAETFDMDTDYAAVRRNRLASASTSISSTSLASSSSTSLSSSSSTAASTMAGSTTNAASILPPATSSTIHNSAPVAASTIKPSGTATSALPTGVEDEADGAQEAPAHYAHAGQYFMALTVIGFVVVILLMKFRKGPGSSRRRRRDDFEFDIIPGEDYSDSDTDRDSLELHSMDQADAEREALFDLFNAESLPDYDNDMFQIGDEDVPVGDLPDMAPPPDSPTEGATLDPPTLSTDDAASLPGTPSHSADEQNVGHQPLAPSET